MTEDQEGEDRERGFLTVADREFLRGEKHYESKQGRYDRRRAIRDRLRNAVLDMNLVTAQFGSEYVERALHDLDPEAFDGMRLLLNEFGGGPDRPLSTDVSDVDPAIASTELSIAAKYAEVEKYRLAREHIGMAISFSEIGEGEE